MPDNLSTDRLYLECTGDDGRLALHHIPSQEDTKESVRGGEGVDWCDDVANEVGGGDKVTPVVEISVLGGG